MSNNETPPPCPWFYALLPYLPHVRVKTFFGHLSIFLSQTSFIHPSLKLPYRPFKSVELLNARIINVLNLTKTYELNICKPQNCISWRIRKRETTWLCLEGVLIFYCSKVFNSGWQTIRATWAWQKNQIKGAIYFKKNKPLPLYKFL